MQKSNAIAIIVLFCGWLSGNLTLAQTVQFRDVIINEFLVRTTPSRGLPERQFVELYNRSNRTINLTGWTIKDESSTVGTFPAISLEPGEYGIVCRASQAADFAGLGKIIAASTLATLNQAGDSITIRTADGFIVDALYYTDAWYRDPAKAAGGFTLELINPELNCSGATNWRATDAPTGGTPGRVNSVIDLTPDNTPPTLAGVSIVNSSTLRLTFSEGMDPVISANPNLYIFNPAVQVSSVSFNANATIATVNLATPLQNGIVYELSLIGLTDCEGNSLTPVTRSVAIGRAPAFGDLLITEIMADPSPVVQLPDEEYIEIYNASSDVIDLKDVRFRASTRSAVIPEGLLFPGEYAVVVPVNAAPLFTFATKVIALPSFPLLTNSGADLSLEAPNGSLVFHIAYSETWYTSTFKRDGGWSLEMIDLNNPCGGRENWEASVDNRGGTPATTNSVAGSRQDTVAPQPVAIEIVNNGQLRLLFSEKISPASVAAASFNIEPSIGIASVSLDLPQGVALSLALSDNLREAVLYRLTLSGITDCVGNSTGTQTISFGLPEQPEPGDIIINELLFDPPTGGEDFVELWNISNKILSLADMSIVREDRNNQIVTLASMQNVPRLLLPGDYIALSARGETVRSLYQSPGPGVFADIPGFPNYVNDGGVVALYRRDLTVLDRFPYDDKLHFRLLDIKKGVSLERINPDKPATDRNNWNSAALSVGGATPGYKNSNFLIPNIKGSLSLSPEVFSPDRDGIDDLLSIAYSLDKPGYLGTVGIYTVEGIPVRKLVRNETLGQEGFFVWDGLDDNDKKARTGIYVVVLEVFDLDGNKDIFRAKCVVASRMR
jgi:hypothetical protein